MAPFQVGDFVTFSGFRRGSEIIAFSIVAQNVQINTLGDIVYIRMELGLLGIDNPSANAEIAESRVSEARREIHPPHFTTPPIISGNIT